MRLTSEYVLNRMKLSSDKEKAEAIKQLRLRGNYQYNEIVSLLIAKGIEPLFNLIISFMLFPPNFYNSLLICLKFCNKKEPLSELFSGTLGIRSIISLFNPVHLKFSTYAKLHGSKLYSI